MEAVCIIGRITKRKLAPIGSTRGFIVSPVRRSWQQMREGSTVLRLLRGFFAFSSNVKPDETRVNLLHGVVGQLENLTRKK